MKGPKKPLRKIKEGKYLIRIFGDLLIFIMLGFFLPVPKKVIPLQGDGKKMGDLGPLYGFL